MNPKQLWIDARARLVALFGRNKLYARADVAGWKIRTHGERLRIQEIQSVESRCTGPDGMDVPHSDPRMAWLFGLQREISRNLVLEATYVGNRNVWLNAGGLSSVDAVSQQYIDSLGFNDFTSASDKSILNTTISLLSATQKSILLQQHGISLTPYAGFPTSQTAFQSILAFPQYLGAISPTNSPLGKNWYDSLQITATKRLSHDLSLNGNYTYSKALSLTSSPDIFNRDLGKGLNTTDLPHQFRVSAEYTVPRIHSGNGILGNKVLTYVLAIGAWAGTCPTRVPPCSVAQQHYSGLYQQLPGPRSGKRSIGPQRASSSFLRDFRGVRLPQENANVSRNFRLKERLTLRIRVEFTNVFNRTQLPQPSVANGLNQTFSAAPTTVTIGPYTGVYSAGYGTINPTAGTAGSRTGLLVARLTF
jgi:hypothetical protein